MKRSTKEDEEEQKRAELLRRAKEAALERESFLGGGVAATARATGALSPVKAGTTDNGASTYPRNGSAGPPQRWI